MQNKYFCLICENRSLWKANFSSSQKLINTNISRISRYLVQEFVSDIEFEVGFENLHWNSALVFQFVHQMEFSDKTFLFICERINFFLAIFDICMYIYLSIYIYIYIYRYIYISISISIYIYIYIYIYVCMYVCLYVCMYVYAADLLSKILDVWDSVSVRPKSFSDFFRGYKNVTLAINELRRFSNFMERK